MKLYELPRDKGVRIKCETSTLHGKKLGDFITFHHVDGMYSYCTVEGHPKEVVHLSAVAEVELDKSGEFYNLAGTGK